MPITEDHKEGSVESVLRLGLKRGSNGAAVFLKKR
jgi:hypothetical protein